MTRRGGNNLFRCNKPFTDSRNMMAGSDSHRAGGTRGKTRRNISRRCSPTCGRHFKRCKTRMTARRLRVEDLPPALRDRFVGVTGKFLLQVYPEKGRLAAREPEGICRRRCDGGPELTGTPVQIYEYTALLKDSYVRRRGIRWWRSCCMVLVPFPQLCRGDIVADCRCESARSGWRA